MGLDISLLETFILVADLESFSGAARKLGLTQPAISFQIKTLEKEVGASLFDRNPGKVVLTPAGRTTYSFSKKVLDDYRKMIAGIPKTTGRVAGNLLAAASNIPGEYILPPIIAEFKTVFPDVTVSLEITDSQGALHKLTEEQTELSFIGTPLEHSGTVRKPFATDRLVLITPPEHKLAGSHKVKLKSISKEPLVNRSSSSGTRRTFETLFSLAGIDTAELNIIAELGSTQAVISAVQSGMGISIISDKAAANPAKSGLVASVDIAEVDVTRNFYAVYSSGRPLSLAAERFLEVCLSQ
ncbi:MAG: LysR family transcriptional regulator [Actinobacteria bacterium]|nr:LysR family transcriptional regulator [Actinomycetota bacterium]